MQTFTSEFCAKHLRAPAEPLHIRGSSYEIRLDGNDGPGWVIERGANGEKRHRIEHALGGKYVYYFLTPMERGRLQVLPVAYDVRRGEWFDTTGSAARGMRHVSEEVLDWRSPQLTFNTSCHSCHVSQYSANYDPASDAYHATWTEPGINCETCHGAGRAHIDLFRGLPSGTKTDDPKIISTGSFSVDQINDTCAPCHAKSIALSSSFVPGARFFDNYDLVGPEHSDFHFDGRDLGENYTFTSWRMSPCVKSGQLSCLHCHTSSGQNRFAEEPNRACLPCHASHVDRASEHSHHPAGSAGSRCVSCHMPTTEFARMLRSDHSMRPPTPAVTAELGSPNACNQCHADKDAAWADRQVREWATRDYQAPVLRVARLVRDARAGKWSRLPEMRDYVRSGDRDEVFAAALVRLLALSEDARKWPLLIDATRDASPLVRAAAVSGLDHVPMPEGGTALLAATRDEYRLVRVRAAASLAGAPREALTDAQRDDVLRATREFLGVVDARPDDAASHHNLGNFHMEERDFGRAVTSFERAFTLMPDSAASLVNASIAHNLAGKNDKAEDCLRRAMKAEPRSSAVQLNLGLLLAEMGRTEDAVAALREAFRLEPTLTTAAYNLCVLLASGEAEEGIEWCRKAQRLSPRDAKIVYTLAYYLRRQGQWREAASNLQSVVDQGRADADSYAMLGDLYLDLNDRPAAAKVFRVAAEDGALPPVARTEFEARYRVIESR